MGRCLDADALCHMPSLHSTPLILRRHFQAESHKLGDQGRQAKLEGISMSLSTQLASAL